MEYNPTCNIRQSDADWILIPSTSFKFVEYLYREKT